MSIGGREMFKKVMIILGIGVFVWLGIGLRTMQAERYSNSAEEMDLEGIIGQLAQIEAKFDKLSSGLESTNKDVLNKLNTILNNQEKIFQELETIKVRATRR